MVHIMMKMVSVEMVSRRVQAVLKQMSSLIAVIRLTLWLKAGIAAHQLLIEMGRVYEARISVYEMLLMR